MFGLILAITGFTTISVVAARWNLSGPSDLTQLWIAARAWTSGTNPYDAVAAWHEWPYPLLYPFPAVLVISPLTPLPTWAADAVFVGLSTALLAWGLLRHRKPAPSILVFASAPFLTAVVLAQWSPLLLGAALVPGAGFLLICKPNIGLALFAGYPRQSTFVGCALALAISTAIWPAWIPSWWAALASAPNPVAPLTAWGGPVLLLALLRWRRPEARLLVALACIPHTTLPYEALPLFLVPKTWPEAWLLWGSTFAAHAGHRMSGPYASQLEWVEAGAGWLFLCAYLPCLVMILRRPNAYSDTDEPVRISRPQDGSHAKAATSP